MTQEIIGELRVRSYLEQWKLAVESGWYHIRMSDHSLFLFKEGVSPSYSFLHSPIEAPSFVEFLEAMGVEDTPAIRRELREEFQLAIETSGPRRAVTPIRFDYDSRGYRRGVHPIAHIHIGLDNDVRIAANKMSPRSFVLFVMRQMYPDAWARLLSRKFGSPFFRCIREESTRLSPDYWGEEDRVELHLA
ncbi:DUF2290 domain-containing protein [bacterium BD-1]|nr:DUF2290 domain-containing protein [Ottowia caeni]